MRREIIRRASTTADGEDLDRFNTPSTDRWNILGTEVARLVQRRADHNAKLIERIEELALDAGTAIDRAHMAYLRYVRRPDTAQDRQRSPPRALRRIPPNPRGDEFAAGWKDWTQPHHDRIG
ncbi:hypothetical protein ACF06P_34545 [Streptomyces sp. NPDC015684]|uniref:hypothetical protein n=1 Tax=Streptomyces sp. NPDC015684 TaxID=3364963 RepID=UPI0036F54CF4